MYRTGYGPADRDRRPAPPGRGGTRPPSPPGPRRDQPAGLPANYLAGGYFDEKGNLRPELLTDSARAVAEAFKNGGLTSGQLRQFWNAAVWVKRRLEMGAPFEAVVPDIHKLEPRVAYAVGRKVAPRILKDFVEKNVPLAVRSAKDFQDGFYEHFQAVVAYHKYLAG